MLSAKGIETNKQEKWYGTKYKVDDISAELLNKIKNPSL
jgi:secreted Zn-dependent insulinase-like peptidase